MFRLLYWQRLTVEWKFSINILGTELFGNNEFDVILITFKSICASGRHLQYYGTINVYKSLLVIHSFKLYDLLVSVSSNHMNQIIKSCNSTVVTEKLVSTYVSTAVACLAYPHIVK